MGFRVIQRTVEQVEAGGGGGRGAVGCSSTNKWSRYEGGGRMEKERENGGATSTGECCDLVGAGIPSIF